MRTNIELLNSLRGEIARFEREDDYDDEEFKTNIIKILKEVLEYEAGKENKNTLA